MTDITSTEPRAAQPNHADSGGPSYSGRAQRPIGHSLKGRPEHKIAERNDGSVRLVQVEAGDAVRERER